MGIAHQLQDCQLIVGNSNPRFSGVTSTMLQTLAYQQSFMPLRVLGAHHLPVNSIAISFKQARQALKKTLPDGRYRVFHARRNNEMLQALILKYVFGAKIKIVFTSTAQRHHSAFTRWLMNRMDGIVSTCNAAAFYLKRKPDVIVPHGIRSDVWAPCQNRREVLAKWNIDTPYALGIFGRVREQKGVHLFVRACISQLAHSPDYTAVVVGAIKREDQPFVQQLQKEIEDAGLSQRIRILGEQPYESLPELFSMMSLVCALSNNEGFGLTVLEAMSSGAAVLATEAGAWPEIVRPNIDGKIVAINNQEAVNVALAELLSDPKVLAEMGRNGRLRVEQNYRIENEAAALCEYFKSLMVASQIAGCR